jgi:integrase
MSIKVTLRQKPISKNRQSLYLDFYPAITDPKTGISSRRQFLGSYLFEDLQEVKKRLKSIQDDKDNAEKNENLIKSLKELIKLLKPLNPIDKEHNRVTLQRAEQIRQKRENYLNKPEIYTGYEKEQLRIKEQGEENFVTYFKTLADKRKASNHDNWVSAYNYLETFTNGNLKFAELNIKFCDDFKEYLLTTKSKKRSKTSLSQNSAVSYFNKLKASLKQAFKDNKIQVNLNQKIDCIETQDVIKQTLTLEELKFIATSDCNYPNLKKYVIFSVLTGMPFKEMQNLVWSQIETSDLFGVRVKMIRQKTNKKYYINISEQAFNLLGEPKEQSEKVFIGLSNQDRYLYFPLWLAELGIKKKMTFHDLRHTYGCLQIDLGTDIYTLQGNMGHSKTSQTMQYAKFSDERKRKAVEKIKLDF